MHDVTIIALQHVFEVEKLESTVDIKWNQTDILEAVRDNIEYAIVSEDLLVSSDERRHDLLIFVQSLSKDPPTNRSEEDFEGIVEVLHETTTYFLC